MRQYRAMLLGRDNYFRAEVDFEVDEATPGALEDVIDEEADRFAQLLMPAVGRIDIDSWFETGRTS